MNIQQRAHKTLTEIDAALALAETLVPTSLHCLKTAIEGLLVILPTGLGEATLTTLCDQWEAQNVFVHPRNLRFARPVQ